MSQIVTRPIQRSAGRAAAPVRGTSRQAWSRPTVNQNIVVPHAEPYIPAPQAMSPTDGSERARHDLEQTFAEHDIMANVSRFIGTQVLPVVPMRLAHGTYPKLTIKELLKRRQTAFTMASGEAGARAPGGGYHRQSLKFTQESYNTEERGFEGIIDENEKHVYSNHFEHEVITARATYRDVLLEQEIKIASQLFSTTNFVPNVPNPSLAQSQDAGTYNRADRSVVHAGGAVKWSDAANCRPVEDVWVAKRKIFDRTGVRATSLIINEEAFEQLRFADQVRDTWMAQGAGGRAAQRDIAVFDNATASPSHMQAAASALAYVLDVEELFVGSSVIDGNPDPTAAFSASEVWGPHALVFVKSMPGVEGLRMPSLGHTFVFADDAGESNTLIRNSFGMNAATGVHVESYWDNVVRAEIIRVRHQYNIELKHLVAGELITNVL